MTNLHMQSTFTGYFHMFPRWGWWNGIHNSPTNWSSQPRDRRTPSIDKTGKKNKCETEFKRGIPQSSPWGLAIDCSSQVYICSPILPRSSILGLEPPMVWCAWQAIILFMPYSIFYVLIQDPRDEQIQLIWFLGIPFVTTKNTSTDLQIGLAWWISCYGGTL